MIHFFVGGQNSGKSRLAEDFVCEISEPKNRYYVATMVSTDLASEERIKRHREQRAGKGFTTIERPLDVDGVVLDIFDYSHACVLIECVTNLVANELFGQKTNAVLIPKKICEQIKSLGIMVEDVVVVSSSYDMNPFFDEETKRYIRTIDETNELINNIADSVKVVNGENS